MRMEVQIRLLLLLLLLLLLFVIIKLYSEAVTQLMVTKLVFFEKGRLKGYLLLAQKDIGLNHGGRCGAYWLVRWARLHKKYSRLWGIFYNCSLRFGVCFQSDTFFPVLF